MLVFIDLNKVPYFANAHGVSTSNFKSQTIISSTKCSSRLQTNEDISRIQIVGDFTVHTLNETLAQQ